MLPPSEGPPPAGHWGTEWVPAWRLHWSPDPRTAQFRGDLSQVTLFLSPKSSFCPLLPIPSHHLSFLAMFMYKQAQNQLKLTSQWSLPLH